MATKNPTREMFFDESENEGLVGDARDSEPVVGSGRHNILELPSKGMLDYPAEVEYRDIMVRDEEVLASASVETYAKTLNSVLKSVLNDCPFYEQLTIFDRDFILIWLWANNYGITKDVEIQCQHCQHKEVKTVDLTEFPVTDLRDNIVVPFTVPLNSGSANSIDIRLLTVEDEMEIESYMNKNKKADFEITSLVASIDTGFRMSLADKMKWARDNISSKEMAIIRDFHRYFKYGADDTIEHVCSECEGVTRGPLPFQTEDILRPQSRSSFDDLLQAAKGSKNTAK